MANTNQPSASSGDHPTNTGAQDVTQYLKMCYINDQLKLWDQPLAEGTHSRNELLALHLAKQDGIKLRWATDRLSGKEFTSVLLVYRPTCREPVARFRSYGASERIATEAATSAFLSDRLGYVSLVPDPDLSGWDEEGIPVYVTTPANQYRITAEAAKAETVRAEDFVQEVGKWLATQAPCSSTTALRQVLDGWVRSQQAARNATAHATNGNQSNKASITVPNGILNWTGAAGGLATLDMVGDWTGLKFDGIIASVPGKTTAIITFLINGAPLVTTRVPLIAAGSDMNWFSNTLPVSFSLALGDVVSITGYDETMTLLPGAIMMTIRFTGRKGFNAAVGPLAQAIAARTKDGSDRTAQLARNKLMHAQNGNTARFRAQAGLPVDVALAQLDPSTLTDEEAWAQFHLVLKTHLTRPYKSLPSWFLALCFHLDEVQNPWNKVPDEAAAQATQKERDQKKRSAVKAAVDRRLGDGLTKAEARKAVIGDMKKKEEAEKAAAKEQRKQKVTDTLEAIDVVDGADCLMPLLALRPRQSDWESLAQKRFTCQASRTFVEVAAAGGSLLDALGGLPEWDDLDDPVWEYLADAQVSDYWRVAPHVNAKAWNKLMHALNGNGSRTAEEQAAHNRLMHALNGNTTMEVTAASLPIPTTEPVQPKPMPPVVSGESKSPASAGPAAYEKTTMELAQAMRAVVALTWDRLAAPERNQFARYWITNKTAKQFFFNFTQFNQVDVAPLRGILRLASYWGGAAYAQQNVEDEAVWNVVPDQSLPRETTTFTQFAESFQTFLNSNDVNAMTSVMRTLNFFYDGAAIGGANNYVASLLRGSRGLSTTELFLRCFLRIITLLVPLSPGTVVANSTFVPANPMVMVPQGTSFPYTVGAAGGAPAVPAVFVSLQRFWTWIAFGQGAANGWTSEKVGSGGSIAIVPVNQNIATSPRLLAAHTLNYLAKIRKMGVAGTTQCANGTIQDAAAVYLPLSEQINVAGPSERIIYVLVNGSGTGVAGGLVLSVNGTNVPILANDAAVAWPVGVDVGPALYNFCDGTEINDTLASLTTLYQLYGNGESAELALHAASILTVGWKRPPAKVAAAVESAYVVNDGAAGAPAWNQGNASWVQPNAALLLEGVNQITNALAVRPGTRAMAQAGQGSAMRIGIYNPVFGILAAMNLTTPVKESSLPKITTPEVLLQMTEKLGILHSMHADWIANMQDMTAEALYNVADVAEPVYTNYLNAVGFYPTIGTSVLPEDTFSASVNSFFGGRLLSDWTVARDRPAPLYWANAPSGAYTPFGRVPRSHYEGACSAQFVNRSADVRLMELTLDPKSYDIGGGVFTRAVPVPEVQEIERVESLMRSSSLGIWVDQGTAIPSYVPNSRALAVTSVPYVTTYPDEGALINRTFVAFGQMVNTPAFQELPLALKPLGYRLSDQALMDFGITGVPEAFVGPQRFAYNVALVNTSKGQYYSQGYNPIARGRRAPFRAQSTQ